LWTTVESATSLPQVFALRQLYVQPEYRGLGIASSLLERTVAVLRERGDGPIISELPGTFDPVHSHLERLGFRDLGRESVLTRG
jgi:GNAT superfamily N-acetyltransferase